MIPDGRHHLLGCRHANTPQPLLDHEEPAWRDEGHHAIGTNPVPWAGLGVEGTQGLELQMRRREGIGAGGSDDNHIFRPRHGNRWTEKLAPRVSFGTSDADNPHLGIDQFPGTFRPQVLRQEEPHGAGLALERGRPVAAGGGVGTLLHDAFDRHPSRVVDAAEEAAQIGRANRRRVVTVQHLDRCCTHVGSVATGVDEPRDRHLGADGDIGLHGKPSRFESRVVKAVHPDGRRIVFDRDRRAAGNHPGDDAADTDRVAAGPIRRSRHEHLADRHELGLELGFEIGLGLGRPPRQAAPRHHSAEKHLHAVWSANGFRAAHAQKPTLARWRMERGGERDNNQYACPSISLSINQSVHYLFSLYTPPFRHGHDR